MEPASLLFFFWFSFEALGCLGGTKAHFTSPSKIAPRGNSAGPTCAVAVPLMGIASHLWQIWLLSSGVWHRTFWLRTTSSQAIWLPTSLLLIAADCGVCILGSLCLQAVRVAMPASTICSFILFFASLSNFSWSKFVKDEVTNLHFIWFIHTNFTKSSNFQ